MYDVLVILLVLFVFNTVTFTYLCMKIVDYMNWKRHWRESRNV